MNGYDVNVLIGRINGQFGIYEHLMSLALFLKLIAKLSTYYLHW
jgi:hypothetical protein